MTNITRIALAVDSRQVRNANSELGNMQRSGQKAESTVGKLGKRLFALGAAAVGVRAIAGQFSAINREGELLQRNMLRTEALIRSTGAAAGFSAKQLHEQARQLALGTLRSTEEVMESQQILLSFRRVSGETFTRATELAADLATVVQTDLKSAMTQLGKALEDPVLGMTAMSRSGVSFTQTQKDLVKELIATGRQAEAQKLILDELASQYGGVARKEAEGLAGAQDTLAQAFQESRQAIFDATGGGEFFASIYDKASEALNEFTAQLESGELAEKIRAMAQPFVDVGKDIEHFFDMANAMFGEEVNSWVATVREGAGFIGNAIMDLPKNFADFVRLATIEILVLVDRAQAYGSAIAGYLDPRTWLGGGGGEGVRAELDAQLSAIDELRDHSIASILEERAIREASTEAIIEMSKRKRVEWEREKEAIDAYNSAVSSTVDQATALDSLSESLENLKRKADPAYAAAQDLASAMSMLQDIFDAGLIDDREFDRIKEGLQSIHDEGQNLKDVFTEVGESIDDMSTGTIKGLKTMQRVFDQGSKGYAELEVAIQAVNAVQAINAVLNQASGDPYTAFGRMAVMAAAVASLGHSVGSLGGSFTDTAKQRQETQGTGSVLGDMDAKTESIVNASEITADATRELVGINRGMLNALQSLQQGIGGATTQIARNSGQQSFDYGGSVRVTENVFASLTGSTIAGFLDDLTLGLFSAAGKLLGGSSRVTDQGVQILGGTMTQMIDGIMVQAFQETQSKKYAWSSRRTSTAFSALDSGVAQQFSLVFEGIAESVSQGAQALGMSASEIERRISQFRVATQTISLKDLSAEDQQAELEAVFGQIFDNLTESVVPFIMDFQRIGEGLGETLVRVGTNVQVTDEAILRLGFNAERVSVEQFAHLSTALIDAAGGLDQFISGMGSFIDKFATEQHKFDVAQSDMTRAFERVNLEIPETRDGMWELMQTLDAGTESGREQIAALLELSDTADAYYKQLDKAQKEALDEAEAVAREAERINNERLSLERQLLQVQGDTDALRSLELEALDQSNRALQERIWAIQDEQVAFNQARQAGTSAVADITNALKNELSGITSAASSLHGDFSPTQASIRSGALSTLRDAMLSGDLSGTGEAAQIAAQINAKDFSSSEAFQREQARTLFLLDSLEREGTQQLDTAEQSLNVLENIDGGIADIVDVLESLSRAFAFDGGAFQVPQFANGGAHSGGLRIVGENGPELEMTGPSSITSNSGLKQALASNARLVKEFQDMKQYLRQTTKNTGETRDQLNRWNRDGLPEERVLT